MLENLGKTVIVTGSQVSWMQFFSDLDKQCSAFNWEDQSFSLKIPCFETRNDGLDNIIGALILAGFNDNTFDLEEKNHFLGYV